MTADGEVIKLYIYLAVSLGYNIAEDSITSSTLKTEASGFYRPNILVTRCQIIESRILRNKLLGNFKFCT
jgi:hypothetical protein